MLDRHRTRLALVVEWLAAAAVIGFWAWQVRTRPHPITWTLGVGSTLFVVTWLGVLHRRVRVPAEGETASDRAVRVAELVRWFTFVQRGLVAFLVFLAPVAVWKAWIDRAMYAAEPWRAGVGFGGVLVIAAGVWAVAEAQKRGLRARPNPDDTSVEVSR